MTNHNQWLQNDTVIPKLYINVEPGFYSRPPWIKNTVSSWPNLRTVTAKGFHYAMEDDPDTIGKHVADFVQGKV